MIFTVVILDYTMLSIVTIIATSVFKKIHTHTHTHTEGICVE